MKKILIIIFVLFIVQVYGALTINSFDSGLNGWASDGSPNDYEKMVPGCTNYPHEYYPSWNMISDTSDTYLNGSLKIFYTNRKNYGATTISYEYAGDDHDLSAYKYLMIYVKGGSKSDVFNIDILENNSPTSNGPWGNADDIWDCQLGPWGKTNWHQLFIPIDTDHFASASEGWNSICDASKFRQINDRPTLTNVAVFSLGIVSQVASPASPATGLVWFDNFIFLNDSDLVYASNPQPSSGESVENSYQPISLNIGSDKSNVRMIINDVEYKTNDSRLTYDGNIVTFVPTEPFSDLVNVYVDAICTNGIPMIAEKWWFSIGVDVKKDSDVIKNLIMPEYFKHNNPPVNFQLYVASPGKLVVSLFSLAGDKLGNIKEEDKASGSINFTWDGKIDGRILESGLYLVEFKYVSEDGVVHRRRIKTFQIID